MAPPFDAYYNWLGIPPTLQPPHLYRLLGLSPFESDAEVIENAARLRAQFLTRQLNGTHPTLAQRMLEEIEHATHLLLDRSQREAYDARLKHQAHQEGRPVASFDTIAAPGAAPRRIVPPHLNAESNRDVAAPPAKLPPSEPRANGEPSDFAAAPVGSAAQASVEIDLPVYRRRRRKGRGWQISLLVLLMFLPAHGVLLWIGYRIAYYKENQAQDREVEPSEPLGGVEPAPVAEIAEEIDVYRWPRYGIVFHRNESAVWGQAGAWLDWSDAWTVEVWLRRQSGDGFQPVFGLYPGQANRRPKPDDEWQGWVLGVYVTEPGREELRLIAGKGDNRRMTRLALPAAAEDLVHLCLVCDGSRATICWNGEPLGAVSIEDVTSQLSPDASFWLGNSPFLPLEGGLNAEVLNLRLSSSARYGRDFRPAPDWRPDDSTHLLPNLETLRTNASSRRPVIDRSNYSHRGELLGASWIRWDEP